MSSNFFASIVHDALSVQTVVLVDPQHVLASTCPNEKRFNENFLVMLQIISKSNLLNDFTVRCLSYEMVELFWRSSFDWLCEENV